MMFFVRAATITFLLTRLRIMVAISVASFLIVLICWGNAYSQIPADVDNFISRIVSSQNLPNNEIASASKTVNKMPERTFVLEGKLTESIPKNKHTFNVPAGMEVQIFTEYIEGDIKQLKLYCKYSNDPDTLYRHIDNIHHLSAKRRPKIAWIAPPEANHVCQLVVEKWSKKVTRYRFRVAIVSRGDMGLPVDAGTKPKTVLNAVIDKIFTGYLSNTDKADAYMLDNLDVGTIIRVTISSVVGYQGFRFHESETPDKIGQHKRGDVRISLKQIIPIDGNNKKGDEDVEIVSVMQTYKVLREFQNPGSENAKELEHSVKEAGSYWIYVDRGYGSSYSYKLNIHLVPPGSTDRKVSLDYVIRRGNGFERVIQIPRGEPFWVEARFSFRPKDEEKVITMLWGKNEIKVKLQRNKEDSSLYRNGPYIITPVQEAEKQSNQ